MLLLNKNKEGYKETTLYLLSNGCMVQTNNDIEITEDIRLALATIIKKAHDDRNDRLVDDISRRCKNEQSMCKRP